MKTMHNIREILSEEMDSIRAKTTTAANVNAICNATGKFLSTIKLEMEYAKMIGKQPSTSFLKLMDNPEKNAAIAGQKSQKKAA